MTFSKIYVAGHTGMVGSAILGHLKKNGNAVVTATSKELDLRDARTVDDFFDREKPDCVILAAAKVGGIYANDTLRGEFIYDNLTIQTNVIESARKHGVKKLVFLGSSCIYPRDCPQPIKEEYLMTGPLEPTNRPYALAKIAGIEMCDAYRDQYGCNFVSVMPTNLSGPNDRYDLKNGHVFASLVRKFVDAKRNGSSRVVLWGTGSALREFLHVDDLVRAIDVVLEEYDERGPINIGYGSDVTIKELAEMISEEVGFAGDIVFDTSMPDGTPKKLIDSSKIRALGWSPAISLKENVEMVVADFVDNYDRYTH